MTEPRRPAPRRSGSARERIAAKRAATRRPLPPALLVGGIGLVAVLLLGILLALMYFNRTVGVMRQADPRRTSSVASSSSQQTSSAPSGSLDAPFNVLLIGVDKRASVEEGVRSDTLIVVHVDPQQRSASMLSIPRDSVVSIPNFGQAKINTAYTDGYNNAAELYGANTSADAGGGALAAETVEQFLGITVDYVAQVDFNGFAALVDTIGGVPVDVERPLLDAEFPTEDYGVERIYIPAGLQVMDGHTALVYARSRHSSDDFGRAQRQQQVLRALLDQIKARGMLENIGSLGEWVDVVSDNVRTTLPIDDPAMLTKLANLARDLDPASITQLSINPNDVGVTMDGSDLYWNQADIEALLARWQQASTTATSSAAATPRIQVLNGTSAEGVATRLTEKLRAAGYTLADPASVPPPFANTLLIDYTGKPELRDEIASMLGIAPAFVQDTPALGAPPQPNGVDLVIVIGQDYSE